MERYNHRENAIALLFLIIPILFVIIGLVFFPYRPAGTETILEELLPLPLFFGLILLGIGFLIRKDGTDSKIKIIGWILFTFFWSTQPNKLYFGEDGDFVNAFLCIVGVFVLIYIAYHEWLSTITKKKISCLNWAAGVAAIAGFIYFGIEIHLIQILLGFIGIEITSIEIWLREVVAAQSAWLLNVFTGNVTLGGLYIGWELAHIKIIFACTAVQSMVIFVGMILPLPKVNMKRKCIGLLVTIVPVYFLNLIRNALVVYLVGIYGPDFFGIAHNIIGKGGSLVALVILLFIVIKIIPEVFDEIICLTDLYKINGPLEQSFKKIWRKK